MEITIRSLMSEAHVAAVWPGEVLELHVGPDGEEVYRGIRPLSAFLHEFAGVADLELPTCNKLQGLVTATSWVALVHQEGICIAPVRFPAPVASVNASPSNDHQ